MIYNKPTPILNFINERIIHFIIFSSLFTSSSTENKKDGLKDSSDIDEDTTSDEVRAVHTSPHHYQHRSPQSRNVEWTFAMGLLYSVSLLTTVGKKELIDSLSMEFEVAF